MIGPKAYRALQSQDLDSDGQGRQRASDWDKGTNWQWQDWDSGWVDGQPLLLLFGFFATSAALHFGSFCRFCNFAAFHVDR